MPTVKDPLPASHQIDTAPSLVMIARAELAHCRAEHSEFIQPSPHACSKHMFQSASRSTSCCSDTVHFPFRKAPSFFLLRGSISFDRFRPLAGRDVHHKKTKKADASEHHSVFDCVGLLSNEPLGSAGVPFN